MFIILSDNEMIDFNNGKVIVTWCTEPVSSEISVMCEENADALGYVWPDDLPEKTKARFNIEKNITIELLHPEGTYGTGNQKYKLVDVMIAQDFCIEVEEDSE